MSALLDSLAAGFEGVPARRAALDDALRDGLPHPRSEAWKYTSLRALERRTFAAAAPAAATLDAALLRDIPAPRLVFVNGRFDPAHSDTSNLPDGVELRPLSQALAGDDPRVRARGGSDPCPSFVEPTQRPGRASSRHADLRRDRAEVGEGVDRLEGSDRGAVPLARTSA